MTVLPVTHERHRVESTHFDVHRLWWKRRHQIVLLVADLVAASAASLLVLEAVGRWHVVLGLPPAWIAMMYGHQAYEHSSLGAGSELYRRVLRGALVLPALAAAIGWGMAGDLDLLHDMILAAPPTALLALAARFVMRRWLHRRWAQGRHRTTAVLVGSSASAVELVEALWRRGQGFAPMGPDLRGLDIAGVCLTDPGNAPVVAELGIPVLGGVADVPGAIRAHGGTALVALPTSEIDAAQLRRLAWTADAAGCDFLLAPALGETAVARVAVRPVGGVPMVQVRAPRLSRTARLPKEFAERLVAATLLLLLAPLLCVVAVTIRLGSNGPALFRQSRVGLHGKHFTMLKFRTMRPDAEACRAELEHANHNSDGLLFKVRDDPRVTRVGATLRRYSIDELPQLINVLSGRMSLIGPRPPLPEEVAGYGHEVRRRLLVKPGLTGLWQVSGRSDLPWDEAVRLDLAYVDNWSLGLDASILLRTGPAVMRGTGAY